MDGPSSDAENETIIATTTYITLSGTHTTESEVFGSSSSSASSLSSKKPEQLLQHQNKTPILNKQKIIDTSTKKQDDLTDIKIVVENEDDEQNVAEEIDTDTSSSPRSAKIIRPKNSLIFYHKIKEKARESECCPIPTIIMDPIVAERQQQLERYRMATAGLPINQSSTTEDLDGSPNRLRLLLRRIGRGLMVCMQMNKDCIFCLMFFVGFILCATMLTIFFYKAMTTLNPATIQYPAIPMGRIYYL